MNGPRALRALLVVCVVLAGCDVPTEPPIFEPRWMVPLDETTVSAAELLPSGVRVVDGLFDIDIEAIESAETLGQLCPACVDSGGTPVAVPAFSSSFTASEPLPDDVLEADATGGSMEVIITNGFDFDPIEGGGTLTVIVETDAGVELGRVELDGDRDTLAPGASLQRSVTIADTTFTGPVRATTEIVSVGGQTSPIDPSDELLVGVTSLLVGSVTVDVTSQAVSIDEQSLDLEEIDGRIADRIVSGAIHLDIENPFGVILLGRIDLGPTSRDFLVPGAGASSSELSYSGVEMRSFVGQPGVMLSGSGLANGTAVTITPGQVMTMKATLDITLEIG